MNVIRGSDTGAMKLTDMENEHGIFRKEKGKKSYQVFGFFLSIALLLWIGIIFFGDSKYADEGDHTRQIHRFMKGNYAVMSQITTLPGYHLVVATVANAFGQPSARQIRGISLVLSLFSIGIFYLVAKKLHLKNPSVRTLQYVFLPISFLYFPLIYTDIFSLFLILTAFFFALSKRYSLSALVSLVALAVRQNNIVWVAFFWVYTYVSENGLTFSPKKVLAHLRSKGGYIIVAAFFGLFVWFNHGIALGDREHQQFGFYMGNLYFFLAVSGVLFLPYLLSSWVGSDRAFLKKRLLFGVFAGIVAAGCFLFFPPEIHEYNLKMKFLRNIVLSFAYHQYAWAYAAAIFSGCLALFLMKFEKPSLALFPFVIAGLAPSFLVEQRYLIVPIVFILLFREESSLKIEYATVLYFLLLSSGLVFMVLRVGIFF